MKHFYSQEIFITAIFVVVLLLLLNPFGFFMPERLVYIMLGGTVALFGLYLSFVVKEGPRDEREQLHRFHANRLGYVLGSAALMVAVVYQGLIEGVIDPWLLLVLGTMVLAKMASLIYSEKNR